MDLRAKLAILADAAKYDASCASSGSKRARKEGQLGDTNKIGICHSYTPDGRCVSLLTILLTNSCLYDCKFCVNRVSSDTPRARFTPEEVAWLTVEFYKRNYIEGLFLSSGIITSPDYTMEQLVAVARTLRTAHAFNGYIHLKAVPGASEDLMAQAGRYADRLSANIELPTDADLQKLAPEKTVSDIETSMNQIARRYLASRDERRKTTTAPAFAPAGQSTQMIVGATPSTDAQILDTASRLYDRFKLRRVYYSAYSPIPHGDARLPNLGPPLVREHRLYQSDWLIRFYGFSTGEITSPDQPNLPLDIDPKLAWALRNRGFFPVDLNRAEKWKLLRVPGLGVRTVDRILASRRFAKIRLADLNKLRVSLKKVRPFVTTADHNPDALRLDRADLRPRVVERQLNLFETAATARTGEI
jgi:putative DNA modification/repair radical SAM protein